MGLKSGKSKGPKPTDPSERFWRFVTSEKGCWRWRGALRNGYGVIGARQSSSVVYAHRLSYEMHFGPIPDGQCVCHACDNKQCVNPGHLYLATQEQNTKDAAAKGFMRGWSRRKGAKKKHVEAQYGIEIREV